MRPIKARSLIESPLGLPFRAGLACSRRILLLGSSAICRSGKAVLPDQRCSKLLDLRGIELPGLDFPGFLDQPVEIVRGIHVASRRAAGRSRAGPGCRGSVTSSMRAAVLLVT